MIVVGVDPGLKGAICVLTVSGAPTYSSMPMPTRPGKRPDYDLLAIVPVAYGTTADNLKAAIAGENYEHTQMYPEFADAAEKDDLPDIAVRLRAIACAEQHHENRFQKILEVVEAEAVFSKASDVWWVCRECGYIHFGKIPPKICPSCDHKMSFYELRCEKY